MKACTECELGMTAREDDGTGKHKVCPPKPDRAAYLAERARRLPHLVELHEDLKSGLSFGEHIEKRTVDNDPESVVGSAQDETTKDGGHPT